MNYNFYFDESFHSRKITDSSLKDNDYFNSYISTGIGIESNRVSYILKKYKMIESKYKKKYNVDELKSEIVSKKHYKFGLSTFNKNEVELYSDIFDFLLKNDILYYVSITDKFEYLLMQCKYEAPAVLNKSACIYSITKLVNVYRPEKVLKNVLNGDIELFNSLESFLEKQLHENGNLKLKENENEAIRNILCFLNYVDSTNLNYKFDYSFTFIGLKKLLNEINVDDVKLLIDKEGIGQICKTAKEIGFNARQIDSKKSPGVRISDMFCGFISRMMKSIYEDTKNNPNIPYKEKHHINEKWFIINEKKFILYKKIALYLKKYINYYYATYISLYFDLFVEFIGLIYYFDNFEEYTDYFKIETKKHCEECNYQLLQRIQYELTRIEYKY